MLLTDERNISAYNLERNCRALTVCRGSVSVHEGNTSYSLHIITISNDARRVFGSQYSSLFSSLGGAMSLYLGISIIMIAEILEFLCLLGWNLYRRARGTYDLSATPSECIAGESLCPGNLINIFYQATIRNFAFIAQVPISINRTRQGV